MIIFLLIVIVILLGIIYIQHKSKKHRSDNLKYIHEKLNNIIKSNTSEKLLVFTDDKEIIPILIEINKVLEHNQKILADYLKAEITMKKMLSNISHDLKTPLTVVLGYIETIKLDSDISSEERNFLLSKVENKTKEVMKLINKFFDLAKLESGDTDIPLTRININEVCKKNILAFYDILTNKGFEVIIDIPKINIYCLGNEEALDRIINNFISNAIKYGNDGMVLGLTLRSDEEYVYVEVWDKGKGISETHQDRVFERMYTLEDSRNKLYQGSGLGLTITKRLVEKLEGEIILESKPYEKTSFIFKLKRITY
ncbi:sensor histidine kinase [Clostridium sp. CM028]|uniref:sensor histidine kinase n=1 Tax=unclassified Clostridium TaxID=2614128 RepID=UPI001C0DE76F|nr:MULTISPECIES: sensor histidine kinase [unclassified Clostridium]MBU3091014.1 sensor histidine kinase [Clostridium sp. CF011]MBW9148604.1 sensor histidine kinase [Clostridium sp. CM028]WAG69065.1 sensor histidine kinase [Clostridium sp. CF011]WLC60803.1 sensor histidine kinase [Clostridium sp. CM028]